jgi:hypothetical protein
MRQQVIDRSHAAAALCLALALAADAQESRPGACALFSAAEVAAFLASPVARIDDVNSGRNDFTGTARARSF